MTVAATCATRAPTLAAGCARASAGPRAAGRHMRGGHVAKSSAPYGVAWPSGAARGSRQTTGAARGVWRPHATRLVARHACHLPVCRPPRPRARARFHNSVRTQHGSQRAAWRSAGHAAPAHAAARAWATVGMAPAVSNRRRANHHVAGEGTARGGEPPRAPRTARQSGAAAGRGHPGGMQGA